ncbi:MAG TPA: CvpA family protein [Bryobacteraceae bacterium]|nr:CvpA family protein [Bryobacteraceae bacterium]
MNWLDLVFGLIIAVSVISGVRKGMVRIGIGFAATIAAFLLAAWFYGTAGSMLLNTVGSRPVANLLGFLIVFTAVMAVGALISFLMGRMLKVVGLSWADRAIGGLFGLVRAALVCVVLLMMMLAFPLGSFRQSVARSHLAPYVIETSRILSAATPHEIREGFKRSYETVRKIWTDATRKTRKVPVESS